MVVAAMSGGGMGAAMAAHVDLQKKKKQSTTTLATFDPFAKPDDEKALSSSDNDDESDKTLVLTDRARTDSRALMGAVRSTNELPEERAAERITGRGERETRAGS